MGESREKELRLAKTSLRVVFREKKYALAWEKICISFSFISLLKTHFFVCVSSNVNVDFASMVALQSLFLPSSQTA